MTLDVGAIGTCRFGAGIYLYVGSARKNLDARIARHLRREKPLRWHIDYLTAATECTVESVVRLPVSLLSECGLVQRLQADLAALVPVPGFGSSDCRAGCGSHLLALPWGTDESALPSFQTARLADRIKTMVVTGSPTTYNRNV